MTANQTIDGVPRELIEWLVTPGNVTDLGGRREELRALLDAPAIQWLAMEVNGKPWVIKEGPNADKWRAMGYELLQVEPAAQPQGDAVTFPRELSDELAELIAEKARVCGGGAFEIWEAICEKFGTPATQPKGEPVAYLDLEKIQPAGMAYATKMRVNHRQTPLYAEQPAPVAVVLPERLPGDDGVCTESHYASGWNACLDEVTRLNTK